MADAEQVRTQAQNKYVGDTVVRQFAQADLIAINKTDLVSEEELASLRVWLANLAPGTPIIATTQSQLPMDVLLGIESSHVATHTESHHDHNHHDRDHHDHDHHDHDHHDHDHHDHDHHDPDDHAHTFETWTIERSSPLTREALERFAPGLGEDIYRAKGFVYLQEDKERRYIYQQVGKRWTLKPSTNWDSDRPQTRLVAIGRRGATNLEALEALLCGFADTVKL